MRPDNTFLAEYWDGPAEGQWWPDKHFLFIGKTLIWTCSHGSLSGSRSVKRSCQMCMKSTRDDKFIECDWSGLCWGWLTTRHNLLRISIIKLTLSWDQNKNHSAFGILISFTFQNVETLIKRVSYDNPGEWITWWKHTHVEGTLKRRQNSDNNSLVWVWWTNFRHNKTSV